jgi:hypothetical protein
MIEVMTNLAEREPAPVEGPLSNCDLRLVCSPPRRRVTLHCQVESQVRNQLRPLLRQWHPSETGRLAPPLRSGTKLPWRLPFGAEQV